MRYQSNDVPGSNRGGLGVALGPTVSEARGTSAALIVTVDTGRGPVCVHCRGVHFMRPQRYQLDSPLRLGSCGHESNGPTEIVVRDGHYSIEVDPGHYVPVTVTVRGR
jgi:hypothetical protein